MVGENAINASHQDTTYCYIGPQAPPNVLTIRRKTEVPKTIFVRNTGYYFVFINTMLYGQSRIFVEEGRDAVSKLCIFESAEQGGKLVLGVLHADREVE